MSPIVLASAVRPGGLRPCHVPNHRNWGNDMKNRTRRLALASILIGTIGLLVPSPAAHGAALAGGGAVVVGQGTISPGLTLVPTHQTVSFTGTAAGGFVSALPGTGGDVGAMTCNFTGSG